jgi:hypothetical protein
MAKIPATMMDLEARDVADMHTFYSRTGGGVEGNWGAKGA